MQRRKQFNNSDEWLAGRKAQGIGASSASAVVGKCPWKTLAQLWNEMKGNLKEKEISDNFFVSRGNRMEDAIRYFFMCRHPEYELEYHQFDLLFQEERPWIFATLDGELIGGDGNRKILEIKTAQPRGKAGWEAWDGKVPTHYYIQILHQFLATGYDMAILCAALYGRNDEVTIREYEFYREDLTADLEWLLEMETNFWNSVQNDIVPPLSILF